MSPISLAAAATFAAAVVLNPLGARAADIRVLCSSAMRAAYEEIALQFEKSTGNKLTTQFDLPPALIKQIDAGEPFDVVILSLDVDGLAKRGLVVADTRTVFGRVGVGIAIRKGSPKPKFGTVEEFKQSLLSAKAIATSGEGSSGRFVAGLIERLGIADQVKPKIKSGGPGHSVQLVAGGEVDFVVSGWPPLVGTPDVEWLGLIPAEINSWVLFTGGVGTKAAEPDAGRALLKFLTTPAAAAVFKAKGFDPAP